ncbi:pantoate--beta-alanine ligase [Sporosarcina koreensis]|uniref:pantoate--beta-alanine ligase n=1 Tax=Sporosarcina koreensis TaxID=334735 RepID=UPI00058C2137|nr:pantoate--beta-alanine ligase [Sporosarcina koreensis]
MKTQLGIEVIETIQELKIWRAEQQSAGKTVGFVPTMGFMHDGHAALIEQAKDQYDTVVASIFVNPTQFGPDEDFDAYPRDLEADKRTAAAAGASLLFCPSADEMYPSDGGIRITPGPLAGRLCGASRPGHFDGVLQVVLKLTNLVRPDGLFFGMKDAQQLAIIETFFRDYNMPARIHRVPTVREADGLAKSSRNVNLTVPERQEAPHIWASLQYGQQLFTQGERPSVIELLVAKRLQERTSGEVDYVTVLSYPDLEERSGDREMILACAVRFSKTRLIDNIIMTKEG